MGFRKVHVFNKTLILKICWGIINNPDESWVKVLKVKYNSGAGCCQK